MFVILTFAFVALSVSESGDWFSNFGSTSTETEDSPFSGLPSRVFYPEENGCFKTELDGGAVLWFSLGPGGLSDVVLENSTDNQHACTNQLLQVSKSEDFIHIEFPVLSTCLSIINTSAKFKLFPLSLDWNKVRNFFYSDEFKFHPDKCPEVRIIVETSTTTAPTCASTTATATATIITQQPTPKHLTTTSVIQESTTDHERTSTIIQETTPKQEPVFRGSSNGAIDTSGILLMAMGVLIASL